MGQACYRQDRVTDNPSFSVAFASIAVFTMIQQPLADLPGRVIFFLHTLISVRRLERYLSEPEIEQLGKDGSYLSRVADEDNIDDLGFEDAVLVYPQHEIRNESDPVFELRCPTFTFPKGKLSIVCGDNASGKSSILMALLGGEHDFFSIKKTIEMTSPS